VLARWTIWTTARAALTLWAVQPKRTKEAPTRLSVTMKNMERPAPKRAGCPLGRVRRARIRRARTARKARPEVARWVNSIRVSTWGVRGMISPLQVGQWAPHPAPEPVARTKAPQRATRMFQTKTPQA
jgi:hypothetical protein